MRTDRTYRKALSHELALAELTSCAGTQLDPEIVRVVLDVIARDATSAPAGSPALAA
jgi:HD-GYP domain-containing protein (c-di-GMP phosphodiesterase class II)